MRTTGPVVFLDSLLIWRIHGSVLKAWLWCEPQHDLGTINHTRTMGPVVFLDSLLMAHPWQHAEGLFSLGVDLNTILE